MIRYSRYIHIVGGMTLWTLAQIALLSAWYGTNISVFYGLLGWQIAFFLLKMIYLFFPPTLQAKVKDFQT